MFLPNTTGSTRPADWLFLCSILYFSSFKGFTSTCMFTCSSSIFCSALIMNLNVKPCLCCSLTVTCGHNLSWTSSQCISSSVQFLSSRSENQHSLACLWLAWELEKKWSHNSFLCIDSPSNNVFLLFVYLNSAAVLVTFWFFKCLKLCENRWVLMDHFVRFG